MSDLKKGPRVWVYMCGIVTLWRPWRQCNWRKDILTEIASFNNFDLTCGTPFLCKFYHINIKRIRIIMLYIEACSCQIDIILKKHWTSESRHQYKTRGASHVEQRTCFVYSYTELRAIESCVVDYVVGCLFISTSTHYFDRSGHLARVYRKIISYLVKFITISHNDAFDLN